MYSKCLQSPCAVNLLEWSRHAIASTTVEHAETRLLLLASLLGVELEYPKVKSEPAF